MAREFERRINFFSGPGAGKSTVAAYVYSQLKIRHFNVELVNEYVKTWAYQGRPIRGFDQAYIMAKQMHAEDRFLQSGVKLIVTDSPLYLQCYYAHRRKDSFCQDMVRLASTFEKEYPSMNIFLSRGNLDYKAAGRYESSSEAEGIDKEMRLFMDDQGIAYKVFKSVDTTQIVDEILRQDF